MSGKEAEDEAAMVGRKEQGAQNKGPGEDCKK